MKEYMYTRALGVTVGLLAIIGATGFGILSFIGMSLSTALNTGNDYSSTEKSLAIMVVLFLLFSGLITIIGSAKIKNKSWKTFYTYFCLLLGIGSFVTFFISFGSIGYKSEIFILGIGITYILLVYLVKRGK